MARNTLHNMIMREAGVCSRMKPKEKAMTAPVSEAVNKEATEPEAWAPHYEDCGKILTGTGYECSGCGRDLRNGLCEHTLKSRKATT